MSRTLLVVPTGAHVGLTSACLALLRTLDERGVRVGYVKPLAQPHAAGAPDPSADLVRKLTSLHVPEPMPAPDVEDLPWSKTSVIHQVSSPAGFLSSFDHPVPIVNIDLLCEGGEVCTV